MYTAGDVSTEVSIQSISKVFTMAQGHRGAGPGRDREDDRRGRQRECEFNSIIAVELAQKALGGPEINPLVNPGVITATSMLKGTSRDEIWKSLIGFYSDCAGRPLFGLTKRSTGRKARRTSATRRSAI